MFCLVLSLFTFFYVDVYFFLFFFFFKQKTAYEMRISDWSSDVCSSDLGSLTTLDVIAIGLASIALFDAVLTGLRSYVFSRTTSKIDVELGARLFRHIVALPLAWFESRRVGDSIARLPELANIRNFQIGRDACR